MWIPVSPEIWGDEGALAKRRLVKREKSKSMIVVGIIVVAIFAILLITYLVTLKYRNKHKPKKDKLPSLWKWPGTGNSRGEYSRSLQDNELARNSTQEPHDREMSGAADPERNSENAGVDRHTSVRSVMTLPAYSPAARENERILGREGERGGVDTVIEFPETMDEEEQRREEEMESLYQIRLARRNEAQDREQRRQERREARQRGDTAALADIRQRAEAAAEEALSQVLIAEHQTTNRDRRTASVQYGELGVQRHDGTRLRANSSESDRRPLLDSAASMSGQSGRSRAFSNSNTLGTSHFRGPSNSSVLSVSTRASDEFEFPEAVHPTRTRDTSGTTDDFEVVDLSHSHSNTASRVASPMPTPAIEIPHEDAPAYEDPPDYTSPTATRNSQAFSNATPQLPSIERLPSIHVTTEPTPVDGRPSPAHSPSPTR